MLTKEIASKGQQHPYSSSSGRILSISCSRSTLYARIANTYTHPSPRESTIHLGAHWKPRASPRPLGKEEVTRQLRTAGQWRRHLCDESRPVLFPFLHCARWELYCAIAPAHQSACSAGCVCMQGQGEWGSLSNESTVYVCVQKEASPCCILLLCSCKVWDYALPWK